MSVRKHLAASAAVVAAVATAVPVVTAGAATVPPVRAIDFSAPAMAVSVPTNSPLYATCPSWYGFRNPAVGCTSWADYLHYTGGGQPGQ